MEDHETLEAGAVICELSDAVKHKVDNLFANGVVTTGVVIGGILLARDQLLGVVQLAVSAGANLVANSWLKINEDATGHVLAGTSLGEEGVEGVVAAAYGFVGRHLTIRLDAVFEAVKLPTGLLSRVLVKVISDYTADTHLICGGGIKYGV